jgi:hypothetical protein
MSDEPIDLDALQADDTLLNRIGAGEDPGADDELVRTLVAWRQQVDPRDEDVAAGEGLDQVMGRWRRRRWWVRLKWRVLGWWKR